MLRRIAPALGLFILSPLVGEFLLGNASIDALPMGLALAPMYGGGAVLIREAARRAGKGWPTIFLLALAFGIVEEGLACQTLFNPSFFGIELLREAHIPALGIGVWWTLFVLTLHTVWSISVPIAIVESMVPDRATTPWLRLPGLVASAVLLALGLLLAFWGIYQQEHFLATTPQLLGTVATALIVTTLAFSARDWGIRGEHPAPAASQVGAFGFAASSVFFILRDLLVDWPLVLSYLLLYGLAWVLIVRWSSRRGWAAPHRLALTGGALMTYAWHAFPQPPILGSGGTVDLIGNTVFAILAVLLLALAARSVRRESDSASRTTPDSGVPEVQG